MAGGLIWVQNSQENIWNQSYTQRPLSRDLNIKSPCGARTNSMTGISQGAPNGYIKTLIENSEADFANETPNRVIAEVVL